MNRIEVIYSIYNDNILKRFCFWCFQIVSFLNIQYLYKLYTIIYICRYIHLNEIMLQMFNS